MARHDGEMHAAGQQPLSLDELHRFFGDVSEGVVRSQEAIACFLAGGEGWREAAKLLDGAFAETGSGLRCPQQD